MTCFCEICQPFQNRLGPLAISLHSKAQPIPILQPWLSCQTFKQVERHIEAVHFFRINSETHVQGLGKRRKFNDMWQELRANTRLLFHIVTRVQGRELHGN
jgi:hypothetical protein